jgi:hypothetical protein
MQSFPRSGAASNAPNEPRAPSWVWHLRGKAETRQVEGAKIALQHNLGLGSARGVTMY